MGKIRYSTNWMGPITIKWYKDRGLTMRETRTLTEDSELTGRKAGDSFKFDRITEEYSAGRIDVRGTGDPYGQEIGLDPMRTEDWNTFSKWLHTFETDDVWNLKDLIELYERNNPKIRWAFQCNKLCGEYECKENQGICKRLK
jgi:hypothetical protein